MVSQVDSANPGVGREAFACSWPIRGGRGAEVLLVQGQRAGVLCAVALAFDAAAARGAVMQRAAQDLRAPVLPVVTAVQQVQMPYLVDAETGRQLLGGDAAQVGKAPVLLDRMACLAQRTRLFACETADQIDAVIRGLEGVGGDPLPERLPIGRTMDRYLRHRPPPWMDWATRRG